MVMSNGPAYSAGWIHARMVDFDDSEGYSDEVPGVFISIRACEIIAYMQATQNVVELHVRGVEAPLALWGNVKDIDKLMSRETVKMVYDD